MQIMLKTLCLSFLVFMQVSTYSFAGDSTSKKIPAIGVDVLMKDTEILKKERIRVKGVVSAVSKENKTLALIDLTEYHDCKVVTCANLTLPVSWSGKMPSKEDKVIIEGKVQRQQGKLIFVADKMEKME